jgi:hypothetical protein
MSEGLVDLTWRFDAALQFAAGLHHSQVRKGGSIPYIAHVMSVCALVLEAGGDEDQAIAALLHDAVEDQGGRPTLETIRHMFGDRVANTVESCSDSMETNPDAKLPWRSRKDKYLEHRRTANADALMVSAADKLHNARAVLADYRELGEGLWSRFNAPKEGQLWYYGALVATLQAAKAPKALVDELSFVVGELKSLVLAAEKQGAENGENRKPESDGNDEWDPITGTIDGGVVWHNYGNPRRVVVTHGDETPQQALAKYLSRAETNGN